MRLIDANELRQTVLAMRERWQDRGYRGVQLGDVLMAIEASPVIECSECEHWARWRTADNLVPGSDYGECAEGCFVHEHDPRDDFGCACFQRRQP